MTLSGQGLIALTFALALAAVVLYVLCHRRKQHSTTFERAVARSDADPPTREMLTSIAVGDTATQPILTIAPLRSPRDFRKAKPLDLQSAPVSKLGALVQAAPSILVAGQAHGKHLMEVVINGDLVRATDGNGFRAFAMGAGKISEQARLFDVNALQNMINAAAIWQVASVIVAQKHLADISKKLGEIKDRVEAVAQFLDNQRQSRLRSTYEYLAQVCNALNAGELPLAARIHLENCERDLLEIQDHLETEFRQKLEKKVEDSELFGSKEMTGGISAKLDALGKIVEDLELCLKCRIAAWHVLCLYPGEPQLKAARRTSIEESLVSLQALRQEMAAARGEIREVDAVFNRKSTLQARRKALYRQYNRIVKAIAQHTETGSSAIAHTDQLLKAGDRPTRILLEYDAGILIGARQG
jgi:hypothetical protein